MKTIYVVSVVPTVPNQKPVVVYCESSIRVADFIDSHKGNSFQITEIEKFVDDDND